MYLVLKNEYGVKIAQIDNIEKMRWADLRKTLELEIKIHEELKKKGLVER